MVANPNFLAKASLLSDEIRHGRDELDSSDWGVCKAAADTLSSIATAAGAALASYRRSLLAALENSRFDKKDWLTKGIFSFECNVDKHGVFKFKECVRTESEA